MIRTSVSIRIAPAFTFTLSMMIVYGLLPTQALAGWSNNPAVNDAVCTAPDVQEDMAIIPDNVGGAIVVWEDFRSGQWDIYAQKLPVGQGAWPANGVAVCTATGEQTQPRIVGDGSGGAVITWHDFRNGSQSDIYAQHVNSNGVVQWAPNGVAVCTAAENQYAPDLIPDGSGGAIITWEDIRGLGSFDVFAQRLDSAGTPQWTLNGTTVSAALSSQERVRIVSDGSGGAIIAWADNRSITAYDIYAQRINASGVSQWTPNGIAVCTAAGDQYGVNPIADGAGGAVITWYDPRTGGLVGNLYSQRVNNAGAPQWTANGVRASNAWNQHFGAEIAGDGAGGIILTWYDFRNTTWDVYAQRLNGSGVPQWTTAGIAVTSGTNDQESPHITADGAGGAIIAWNDNRISLDTNIYAQRFDSSGAPGWQANGILVCSAPNQQFNPRITATAAGETILVWQDYRSGSQFDIYTALLNGSGRVGGNAASDWSIYE